LCVHLMMSEPDDCLVMWGAKRPYSFRSAVELCNSSGVLPQLDVSTIGHLLSTLLRRVVVDAFEVDSFDVMAVTGDKIRAIV
jgi:hypothetical protein